MTRVENSITINTALEEVFSYASDWRKWHLWFEGVSSFVPLTKTSDGNGTRYAYQARMFCFSVALETRIQNFESNKGWKGISTKGPPHITYWIFEPVDDGTRFTYCLEYEFPIPVLGKIIDRMILKPQWERIIRRSLQNLDYILTN